MRIFISEPQVPARAFTGNAVYDAWRLVATAANRALGAPVPRTAFPEFAQHLASECERDAVSQPDHAWGVSWAKAAEAAVGCMENIIRGLIAQSDDPFDWAAISARMVHTQAPQLPAKSDRPLIWIWPPIVLTSFVAERACWAATEANVLLWHGLETRDPEKIRQAAAVWHDAPHAAQHTTWPRTHFLPTELTRIWRPLPAECAVHPWTDRNVQLGMEQVCLALVQHDTIHGGWRALCHWTKALEFFCASEARLPEYTWFLACLIEMDRSRAWTLVRIGKHISENMDGDYGTVMDMCAYAKHVAQRAWAGMHVIQCLRGSGNEYRDDSLPEIMDEIRQLTRDCAAKSSQYKAIMKSDRARPDAFKRVCQGIAGLGKEVGEGAFEILGDWCAK